MNLPPPPALSAGTYLKNAQVGLGKTASWNYPFAVIKADTWTCVAYVSTDPDGNPYTFLTVPDSDTQSDYYYPEWVQTIDYSTDFYSATHPRIPWKVRHNGLYYEPSCWLTSTHVGKPPSTAEAALGDKINKKFQYYTDSEKKEEVCRNQSHPIRAWLSLGSLETDNGWNNAFDFTNPDPFSGEVKREYVPVSFEQRVTDPKKHGGDWYGSYTEEYYPQMFNPVKWVDDPERAAQYTKGNMAQFYESVTLVKQFDTKTVNGLDSNDEPISWNSLTGKMATADILSTSGYVPDTFGGFYNFRGVSINLWRQKLIRKTSRVKKTMPSAGGGVSTYYKIKRDDTVSEAIMPESKTMIVCRNPGPGFSSDFVYYGTVYNALTSVTDGPPTSGSDYSYSQKYKLFLASQHPVVFTRKFYWYEYTQTITTVETKVLTQATQINGQPVYGWRQTSFDASVSYEKKEGNPSFNQLVYYIYQPDKDGGTYISVDANKVGSYTYSTTSSGAGTHTNKGVTKDILSLGIEYAAD
jgi:hypothetical protein